MSRLPSLATSVFLIAVILVQACSRGSSPLTTNPGQLENQIQHKKPADSKGISKREDKPPSGRLSIWTPIYQGMNPQVQQKINITVANLVSRFEKDFSNIEVILKQYPDTIIYKKYSQKVSEGLGPDLLLSHSFMIPPLSRKKDISPIDNQIANLESIYPKLLKASEINGTLYAIPFIINVQLLCYNKRDVSKAPATFQQLLEISESGTSTAVGGNFLDLLWGLPGVGQPLFGQKNVDTKDKEKGLVKWISLLNKIDEDPNLALFKDGTIMNNYFSQGKISVMNCWSVDLPWLRDKIGETNLGISTLPTINGKPAQPRVEIASFATNPNMSSNQKKIARRFIDFSISIDQQQQIAINWDSLLPVNRHSGFNQQLFPVLQPGKESLASSYEITPEELLILETNFDSIQNVFGDAVAGLISPAKAGEEIIKLLQPKQ